MSATYIVIQRSEAPDPPVGTVRHISTDGRVLIKLSEGTVAPAGALTREEAENELNSDIVWQSPAMPWNL